MDILLILPIIQAFDIRADYEQFPNPLPVTSQKKMYDFENQAVMEYETKGDTLPCKMSPFTKPRDTFRTTMCHPFSA